MTWLEVQITTTLEAEEAIVNLFYEVGAKAVSYTHLEPAPWCGRRPAPMTHQRLHHS